jgi:hypothetical protein
MCRRRAWAVALLLLLSIASCTSQPPSPRITLSPDKVADQGHVQFKGTGFTPKASVRSQMKRPDGTLFSEIRFLTDENGEFTHTIDSLTLLKGKHEVWVIDSSGVSSNVAVFETLEK